MRVLIAPDSFKEALSANEVAAAIAHGFRAASPAFITTCLPVADGGEGTSSILCDVLKGEWIETATVDALLRPCAGGFAWFPERKLAIIELAEAAGLHKLSAQERNPLHTSTFGVGMLMAQAADLGVQEVVLTLGGSATNDAGTGMAAALGWQFFAESEAITHPKGSDLARITRIEAPDQAISFTCTVLSDVDNPLVGNRGASRIFAPQKGASPEIVEKLENGMQSFAALVARLLPKVAATLAQMHGVGAAGGTAYGAAAFLDAQLKRGAPEVLRLLQFESYLDECDVLITGEGCLDQQTEGGKLIASVAALARERNVPVIAICGVVKLTEPAVLESLGITAAFSLGNGSRPLSEALAATATDLERVGYQVACTLMVGSHLQR